MAMGHVIAVTGKGGTGKTTIAALLVRLIIEKKLGSLLAVDADPNSNLAELLGVKANETIGGIIDDIAAHPEKVPQGCPKDRFIEYQVQAAVREAQGFDIITMGRPEGPGCYCYVNNVLRNIMGKLVKDYGYVVIDNEAGLEHLSRRTTRSADTLLVVSDATPAGLRAAKRIRDLTRELGIQTKKNLLLINRSLKEIEKERLGDLDLECIGHIPDDPEVNRLSLNGGSLFELGNNAAALSSLREIGERIWN